MTFSCKITDKNAFKITNEKMLSILIWWKWSCPRHT